MKKLLLVVLGPLAVLLSTAFQGYPSTLCGFLQWVGTAVGLTAFLAGLLDWVAEYVPSWDSIESKWKRLIILGMCLAASLLAVAAQHLLCGQPLDWDVLFRAVQLAFAVFTANQIWHGRRLEGSRNSRRLARRL